MRAALRIGLVAHHEGPIAPPFVGGVESFTYYLARWLARRGHEALLFAVGERAVPGVTVVPLKLDWTLQRVGTHGRLDAAVRPTTPTSR